MKKFISSFLAISIFCGIFFSAVPVFAKDANVISKKNPAVVIRTSFATCKYDEGFGGVHTAVPIKDKEGFVLYDVIIWEDRINLYKFPNNVEHNEDGKGFDFSCDVSTKKGQKKYIEWRESFCLKSVKCKNTNNVSKCSSTAKDAYIDFFKIVKKKSPSKNVILKYSGHGYIGFCKALNVEDTKTLMNKGVSIFGGKFALIDFGTNCQSGTTDYLNVYSPFANYILLNQKDYGGFSMDDWDYEIYKKVNTDYNYSEVFKIGKSVRYSCEKIIDLTASFWPHCKKNIKKGKHEQSMTLIDAREYESFCKEFRKHIKSADSTYGKDVYSLVKKYGNSKLKDKYEKLVIYYKDNNSSKKYFKWDKKCYGLTYQSILPQIKLSKTSFTYNGKTQKPSVKVTANTGWVYSKGQQYKVSIPSSKKVGEYKAKVTVFGGYGSIHYIPYTIKPKTTKISKLTAKDNGFKVTWSKRTTQSTGYQIRYSTSSKFSSYKDVLITKDTTTSKTVKKLKNKKKYYVKIRTYKTVDGKKIYSSWSDKKSIKTK